MKKQNKPAAAAAKTNKHTMTDTQKELKRQRDARYRAKKRAEKAAKAKPAKASKPEAKPAKKCEKKCSCKPAKHEIAVKEIKIDCRVQKDMEPIFREFVGHIVQCVAHETACLLGGFHQAINMANRHSKK